MQKRRISDFRIVDLKLELKNHGLSQQGKKCELIKRLKGVLNSSFLCDPKGKQPDQQVSELKPNGTYLSTNKQKLKPGDLFFKLTNKISQLENQVQFLKVALTKLKKRNLTSACKLAPILKDNIPQLCNSNKLAEKSTVVNNTSKKVINNIKCKNLSPIATSTYQKKILIVGDSNGEQCVSLFNSAFRNININNFLVSAVFKPNALFLDVVKDLPKMCKKFNFDDHIFVIGGTADCLKGKCVDKNKLFSILSELKHTNVTLLSTTYCQNRLVLSKFMYDFNCVLFKTSGCFHNVNYVETNRILQESSVSNYYLNLTYFVKKVIIDCTVQQTFVNNNNLICVPIQGDDFSDSGEEISGLNLVSDNETSIVLETTANLNSSNKSIMSDIGRKTDLFFRASSEL